MTTLPKGTLLERYRIMRVLGEGGFGVTYLAKDEELGKKFAIKEYFPQSWSSRDETDSMTVRVNSATTEDYGWGLNRFKEEARTLARFRHPNIVNVSAILDANNTAYMVLDYEEGDSLEGWLRKKKRAPAQADLDAIVAPVLDALELIHSNGILHRDIAPDNIYIRADGSPVLLDFGSAREAMGQRTKTVSAIVKQGYSPIEQYSTAGKDQGPWTDIYALGATLYRAVTGKRPPEATERSLKDEYVPATEAGGSKYRDVFLAAIDAALERHFEARPQSVAGWRAALFEEAGIGDRQTRAAAPGTRLAAPAPAGIAAARPVRWAAVLGVLALLLMGGGSMAWVMGWLESAPGEAVAINSGDGKAPPGSEAEPEPAGTPPPPAVSRADTSEEKQRLAAESEAARDEGIAHFRAGRYERAVVEFTTALRLDPANYRAFGNRGLAHAGKGDQESALKDFNRALAINPKDIATLDNRASLYVRQGKLDRAIEDYDDAILYRPDDAQLHNNRGFAWLLKERYNEALEDFDTAIRIDPRFHAAYANRAEVHESQGRKSAAIADHRKALELKAGYAPSEKALQRLGAGGKRSDTQADDKTRQELAPPAKSEPRAEQTPVEKIKYVYDLLREEKFGDGNDPADMRRGVTPLAMAFFSQRFISLLARNSACWDSGNTEGEQIWVAGSDYRIKDYDVKVTALSDTAQTVTARFRNFDEPQVWSYRFVKSGEDWFIDDVFNGKRSLAKEISNGCNG